MTSRSVLAPLAIVAIALALRLAWVAHADFAPTVNDDAGRYDAIARSLADGGGFVHLNGTTTMFWPPGYPFFLASVYKAWPGGLLGEHELIVALALQAALSAATVALAYAIGRRAFGVTAAMLGTAILALFPSMIFLAGVTLTETVFTFMFMLALWLIVEAEARGSMRLVALVGAVIGCAALVRGQALLLPLAAIPFWLLSAGTTQRSLPREEGRAVRSALTRALLTLAIALAAVTPWSVRNFIESGSAVPISSNDGVNFYIGHSPDADGRSRKVDELVFRYPELEQAEAEAHISRDGYREGIEWAVKHPAREAELAARKLFFLYWRDDEGIRWNTGHSERAVFSAREYGAWIWLSNAYYLAVLSFAGVGLAAVIIAMRSRRPSPAALRDGQPRSIVLLLSVIAYWTLVHIAFFGDPRFHAPVMPVFALFAGAGVAALVRIASRRRAPTTAA